ncbi:MAG TPA: RES family NAD+ phosphorylase [Longimicrobium sp.]
MPIVLPRRIPTITLPRGTVLWRVHRREHGALWFGPAAGTPPRGRFDAPTGEFGICYFGESLGVAMLESLVRGSRRLLDRADLEARAASTVALREPVKLLQFEGPGLAKLGIGAEQAHTADYGDCQRMMLDLSQSPMAVDGVQYRSRWDTSLLCWGLFDRAQNKLEAPHKPEWLGDGAVIGPTLDRYELEIT